MAHIFDVKILYVNVIRFLWNLAMIIIIMLTSNSRSVMVMVFKFSEPKRIDSGWPVFWKNKFHRNSSENILRGQYQCIFHSENISKPSDSNLWTSRGFISRIDWTVIESSGPPFSRKFSSLTKTWFSQTVLKVLQNHSRDVCVTLKQFCQCHTFLTLSENEGHEGQKGQILKNVANCLKRMQNKNFLWNPSLNHVLTRFTIP